jgi:hypothetical protein
MALGPAELEHGNNRVGEDEHSLSLSPPLQRVCRISNSQLVDSNKNLVLSPIWAIDTKTGRLTFGGNITLTLSCCC